jgi:hypothetical protein
MPTLGSAAIISENSPRWSLVSKTDISQFKTDISQFKTDISQFKTDISWLWQGDDRHHPVRGQGATHTVVPLLASYHPSAVGARATEVGCAPPGAQVVAIPPDASPERVERILKHSEVSLIFVR